MTPTVHYGDPLVEQRTLHQGPAVVDLSHRDVVRITGDDRARLLHALGTQNLEDIHSGQTSSTFLLDPGGRIRESVALVASENALLGWVGRGRGQVLVEYLNSVKLSLNVEAEVAKDLAVSFSVHPVGDFPQRHGSPTCLSGYEVFHSREDPLLGTRVGLWAYTARRIAHGIPEIGMDTDPDTTPSDLGMPPEYVSSVKSCYPGYEAVSGQGESSQVSRRLVRFHLDGSSEKFVIAEGELSTPVVRARDPRTTVGFMGSVAYHYQLGPIGLGLVDSSLDMDTELLVDNTPARIEYLS